ATDIEQTHKCQSPRDYRTPFPDNARDGGTSKMMLRNHGRRNPRPSPRPAADPQHPPCAFRPRTHAMNRGCKHTFSPVTARDWTALTPTVIPISQHKAGNVNLRLLQDPCSGTRTLCQRQTPRCTGALLTQGLVRIEQPDGARVT